MDVSRIRALRGPNIWTRSTALELMVQCSEAECQLSNYPWLETRLRARFPEVGVLPVTQEAGKLTLAHVLEMATLALQAHAGCPVTFSRTVARKPAGLFQVVVEYSEEEVGRKALEHAQALLQAALDDTPFDLPAVLAELKELDEDIRLGPSTGAIVNALVARGVPYRRLTQGSLVQFGWGAKQRRIQAAEVDSTSAIAESIAQDKDLTKQLLHAAGVPVPMGEVIRRPENAWPTALEVGLPVVVKPLDGNQGKGVTVNVADEEHMRVAFAAAKQYGDDIIIERYIPGADYRLLVIGNRLIAAARREPPHVIGDGVHTVRELVAEVNRDPRRGDGHATSLSKIRFDDIAVARLAQQGLKPEDVPPKGQRVVLRNNANLSTGGTATDVTDSVHPDVAARIVEAALMVGLDVCGVDLVAESVERPLEETGGAIVEVNAAPGLRMHISPSYGKGRAVGDAIADLLFPAGDDGRIPVVAVTGVNGKTTTTRLTAHLLRTAGLRVGMTNTDGVYVNGRQTDSGDCSGPKSARNVLLHPDVDAAVLETARGGILREGLGFDRCSVAVVTNIGTGDHLGLNFIDTVEDIAVVKRVIVQNVSSSGVAVLNAADPLVAGMAHNCPGEVIFFASDANHPLITRHRAQGGRVVVRQDNAIVADDGQMRHVIELDQVPFTHGGLVSFQVENAMASVAAAWALKLEWGVIRAGLASFTSDAGTVPGRFNLMDYRGARLIADYGHNPDAIAALIQAVKVMPANKRVVVISGAGDRRDEDIRNQTRLLGAEFDHVVLFQDACQRGRQDGEVLGLLREGLVGAARTTKVDEIRGEFLAIDTALAALEPGDLCLILVDQVQESLDYLADKCRQVAAR